MKEPRYGSNKWIRFMYTRFKNEFFSDTDQQKLPTPDEMTFFWYDGGTESFAKSLYRKADNKFFAIGINTRLRRPFFRKVACEKLIHEMIHLVCGADTDCQEIGGPFDKKMFEIVNHGALVEFW